MRRVSIEEDLLYHRIVHRAPPPCSPDPPPAGPRPSSASTVPPEAGPGRGRHERLPPYQSSIALAAVFAKKLEIEKTVKRAEDRRWRSVFVSLNGTALHLYSLKKDWGIGRAHGGAAICADNPPWIKIAKLDRSYSLQHADAGIAADYQK